MWAREGGELMLFTGTRLPRCCSSSRAEFTYRSTGFPICLLFPSCADNAANATRQGPPHQEPPRIPRLFLPPTRPVPLLLPRIRDVSGIKGHWGFHAKKPCEGRMGGKSASGAGERGGRVGQERRGEGGASSSFSLPGFEEELMQ